MFNFFLVGGLMFDLVQVDFTDILTTKLCAYDHHFSLTVFLLKPQTPVLPSTYNNQDLANEFQKFFVTKISDIRPLQRAADIATSSTRV